MPLVHDGLKDFSASITSRASTALRSVLAMRRVNKGGIGLGPDLATRNAGRVRRVRFRRRNLAGGILSSSVRRQRQPTQAGHYTGQEVKTPESDALRCFNWQARARAS